MAVGSVSLRPALPRHSPVTFFSVSGGEPPHLRDLWHSPRRNLVSSLHLTANAITETERSEVELGSSSAWLSDFGVCPLSEIAWETASVIYYTKVMMSEGWWKMCWWKSRIPHLLLSFSVFATEILASLSFLSSNISFLLCDPLRFKYINFFVIMKYYSSVVHTYKIC